MVCITYIMHISPVSVHVTSLTITCGWWGAGRITHWNEDGTTAGLDLIWFKALVWSN